MLDDFDDLTFPNANYRMGRIELVYWWDPDSVNKVDESRVTIAVGARRGLEALEDYINLFEYREKPTPLILAKLTRGYIPEHMGFEIKGDSSIVLDAVDALNNHHVAFRHPTWLSGLIQNAPQATVTRKNLLETLSSEDMFLVGFHLPSGGIGRAAKSELGYLFLPR